MAAKGVIGKAFVTEEILKAFENAFVNGKEIRIPVTEDGNDLQIKVTLTAAKDMVEPGAAEAIPGAKPVKASKVDFTESTTVETKASKIEATEDEKNAISDLMSSLGLE